MLAEYVALDEDGLVEMPDEYSFEEASTLPCAALTAWQALVVQGGIKAGESVLILGTGGVSIFALQIAKLHGARVIGTSSSEAKLARAIALGLDTAINYVSTPDWHVPVFEATAGRGVDHVVEIGGAGTLVHSMEAVRTGGCIHVVGFLSGPRGQINPLQILDKSITLRGIHVGSREMFLQMNRAFSFLRIKPVIDRVFSFQEAKAAYQCMQSGSHFGKIVISLS